jgi:hypothetical protein
MMATKRNTHSICWQWTTGSLLLLYTIHFLIIIIIGTCDGFRRNLSPAILKDSCILRHRNHPCSSTSAKFAFDLSYSTNSFDVLTPSTTTATTAATDFTIPVSSMIPETTTVVVSDGFDPSGFFVNVFGTILNGPG